MKIKGDITMLIDADRTYIKVRDREANCTIVEIELTPTQLSQMLSRLGNIHCNVETCNLSLVGKKHENSTFVFEIPKELSEYGGRDEEKLVAIAQSQLSDGWIAEKYFRSQDSFFIKDGKHYARCVIRRWVDVHGDDDLTNKK